jgi:hypothetical protein
MALPELKDAFGMYEIHEAAINRYCGDAFRVELSNVRPDAY